MGEREEGEGWGKERRVRGGGKRGGCGVGGREAGEGWGKERRVRGGGKRGG